VTDANGTLRHFAAARQFGRFFENAVEVEPVGEFTLKGIRRPMAAHNVLAATPPKNLN
jgi:hypothetical protein